MSARSSMAMGNAGPQVVEFNVEAVRKRPGMYVGDTARFGLYHLGYFVLDLMLSASARAPSRFDAQLEPDGTLLLSGDCEPREAEATVALLNAGTYRGPPELLEGVARRGLAPVHADGAATRGGPAAARQQMNFNPGNLLSSRIAPEPTR